MTEGAEAAHGQAHAPGELVGHRLPRDVHGAGLRVEDDPVSEGARGKRHHEVVDHHVGSER
ncbi:MAG: hypothetical protein DMF82_17240, partial [Acidobacteria bacterium]